MRRLALVVIGLGMLLANLSPAHAEVPVHAAGLQETLLSVELEGSAVQVGVLSRRPGSEPPTHLAVLLPGHPSVVKPVMGAGHMASSSLTGNFLIRARRHLVNEQIATLLVDCRSDAGSICTASYQSSAQRQADVHKLIELVKRTLPSIRSVWLVGTSMGTLSSAFMPGHAPGVYQGAIHTASITEPYVMGSYREMADVDMRDRGTPHFIVHHRDDPCPLTTWRGAEQWRRQFSTPLLTVTGGSGFTGRPCQAHTEHGFKGREPDVMKAIAEIIQTGRLERDTL
jgi:alpha/beta superfamily hydrolase